MTFCSIVVKDHFKITFNIKKYIDIDGNVIFYILNTSDDSISVGTEDIYDAENLCSNDSYESTEAKFCFINMNSIPDLEPLEFADSPYDKFENCPACDRVGLNTEYSVIIF